MIDCKTVEEKIIAAEPLDVESELHLLECRNCQAFAHVHNAVVGLPEISKETDAVAIAAFHAANRRSPMRVFQKIATLAACLVVVLALTLVHMKRHRTLDDFALSAEEQWMLAYSLDNDDISEMELSLSGIEMQLMASANSTAKTSSKLSATDLQYEILSLEMDLSFQ